MATGGRARINETRQQHWINDFRALSKSWKCLGKGGIAELSSTIVVSDLSAADKEGFDSLQSKAGVKFEIEARSSMQLYFALLWNEQKSENGGRDERFPFCVDKNVARECIIQSVDHAVLNMTNSRTKERWDRRCGPFEEVIANAARNNRGISRAPVVFPDEVERFGTIFSAKMLNLLRTRLLPSDFDGFDSVLLYCSPDFGVKTSFDDLKYAIQSLPLDQIIELAFDVATDYTCANTCFTWNRQDLANLFGEPKLEHYPGFSANGCGNFDFEFDGLMQPLAVYLMQDYGDVSPGEDGTARVRKLKTTTTLYERFFREYGQPFQTTGICEVIMARGSDWNIERLEEYRKNLRAFFGYLNRLTDVRRVDAKLHALITMKKPGRNAFDECKRLYFEVCCKPSIDCLRQVHYNQFSARAITLSTYFPARALGEIVSNCLEQKRKNPVGLPSYKNVQLASCCEMLLSWSLYGIINLSQKRGCPECRTLLCRLLNLQPSTFKEVKGDAIFYGLEFAQDFIRMRYYEMTLTSVDCLCPELSHFITPGLLERPMELFETIVDLASIEEQYLNQYLPDPTQNITEDEILENVCSGRVAQNLAVETPGPSPFASIKITAESRSRARTAAFNKMSSILYEMLRFDANRRVMGTGHDPLSEDHILQLAGNQRYIPQNCLQFVSMLDQYPEVDGSNVYVSRAISSFQSLVGTTCFAEFLEHFANYLELKLYDLPLLCLFHPLRTNVLGVVFPLKGQGPQSFSLLEANKRTTLCRMVQLVFRNYYRGVEIPVDKVVYTLSGNEGRPVRQSMEYLFSVFWSDWVLANMRS